MTEHLYRVGDSFPPLSYHVLHELDKSNYDITGFTGEWKLREMEATSNKASGSIQITDYTNGYFECRWGPSDLDTAGIFYLEFEFSSGSYKMTLPGIDDNEIIIKIIEGI